MTAPDPAELFARALEQPAALRHAFLAEACGDDEDLVAEIMSLLDVHERHPDVLTRSAGPLAPGDSDAEPSIDEVPARIGPFVVRRLLGRGGMGHVYEAIDDRDGGRVALKVVPPSTSSHARACHEALEREARALAALDHPAIASIRGVELHGDRLLLVMSIAEGRTLAELLEAETITRERMLRIVRRVVLAVEAAHARELVHLDLKPANVVVNGRCAARVLDFGLARRALRDAGEEGAGTRYGGGTPGYMSPEQARGGPCDYRSDLFALGCVLFECMSGRRAFEGDSAAAVLAAAGNEDPPWDALPEDASDVTALIRRCMARAPDDRPRGAEDVRRALTAAIDRMHDDIVHRPALHIPPRPTDAFVGSAMWLEHLACLLDDGEVVQLVGTGGCGKTRLALELAHALIEGRVDPRGRPDRVTFVELAPLTDPALVARTVANALDVRESQGTSLMDAIAARAAEGTGLLVLDNAEHVLDACRSLVDALRTAAPRLHILLTSREPLALTGSISVRVRPLAVPRVNAPTREIASSDAVRLLAARADLPADEAPDALATICRSVGGIPLGIELAARAAAEVGPAAVASSLTDTHREAAGHEDRSLPAPASRETAPDTSPQRTLERLLAWSHDRLSPASACLFRRLAVFRGGWSQEAARAIASDDALPEPVVAPALSDLATRFLIEREPGTTGTASVRYRFLEPVRAFAETALGAAHETEWLRTRHARWFADLAIVASPELRGPAQGEWLARLDGELDNVRAALDAHAASVATGDGEAHEQAFRFGAALGQFWLMRAYWSEGRAHLARLLAPGGGSRAYVNAVTWDGNMALHAGQLDDAATRYREAVAIGESLEDIEITARALTNLAVVFIFRRDLDPARDALLRGLEMQRALGHDADVATTELNLGVVAEWGGDLEEAQRRYEASYAARCRLDDRAAMASALNNLGAVAEKRGDLDAARSHYEHALSIRRDVGDRRGVAESLRNLGAVATLAGRREEALASYEESLAIFREIDGGTGTAETLEALAAELAERDPERALGHLVEAEAIRERTKVPPPPTREKVRRETEQRLVERLGEGTVARARARQSAR